MMLAEVRDLVCKMWDTAEKLDETGIAKHIPSIVEGNDTRHTMKGEIITRLFDLVGVDNELNGEQLNFLQYVLHAPISEDNKREYASWVKANDDARHHMILPYLIMMDKKFGTEHGKLYAQFLSALSAMYLRCLDKVELGGLIRYASYARKDRAFVEAVYGNSVDYDALHFLSEEQKSVVEQMCELLEKCGGDDEVYNANIAAFRNVIQGNYAENPAKAEKRYREFWEYLESIEWNPKDQDEEDDTVTSFEEEPRSKEELKGELDSLIGLGEVKAQVQSMFNIVQIREECKKRNIKRQPMSYHMVFMGNPGTGKTTVARLIAEIYHSMGLLSKGHLIEVSRADLVAGYVGHTAIKVQEVIKKAKGGVLFIDEAYALTSHSENDFGHEAIETLIKGMEDNRDDLIVIIAGYPRLMEELLDTNPGLRSRFSKTIYFSDYNADELTEIFKKYCRENQVRANKSIMEVVHKYMEVEVSQKTKNFGNGRMVRNFFEQVMINQANRLVQKDNLSNGMLCHLSLEDIPRKFIIEKMFAEGV